MEGGRFCDVLCAGAMSYSSPYLHGVGKYFGHIVLVKCLINWFDINLKGKRSKLPWHEILKGRITINQNNVLFEPNQLRCTQAHWGPSLRLYGILVPELSQTLGIQRWDMILSPKGLIVLKENQVHKKIKYHITWLKLHSGRLQNTIGQRRDIYYLAWSDGLGWQEGIQEKTSWRRQSLGSILDARCLNVWLMFGWLVGWFMKGTSALWLNILLERF